MHKTSHDVYFMNKTQIAAQHNIGDKEICVVLNNKISCIIYDRKRESTCRHKQGISNKQENKHKRTA
jgi:hypothetical protein